MEADIIGFPVFRTGLITRADNPLERMQSLEVANKIIATSDVFSNSVCECVERHKGKLLGFKPGYARMEYKETPVVRFPEFEVKLEEKTLLGSISLTVCCEQRRSKIWSRVSLRRLSEKPAASLSLDAVKLYYKELEPVLNCMTAGIREQYEKTLQSVGKAKALNVKYRFKMYGINSSDEKLRKTLMCLSEGKFSNLEQTLSEDSDSFLAFMPLFEVALDKRPKNPEEMVEVARKPNRYLRFLENRDESKRYHSISLTEAQEDEAMISCLCYGEASKFNGHSPADMATAALLDRYARAL